MDVSRIFAYAVVVDVFDVVVVKIVSFVGVALQMESVDRETDETGGSGVEWSGVERGDGISKFVHSMTDSDTISIG